MASQLYLIVLAVHTRDVRNHDRLEWLLNHILSFSWSVYATYKTMTDYRQCGAHSALPQLFFESWVLVVSLTLLDRFFRLSL